ncbi:involucrin isoform X2 [Lutzomyia longipalpis]|uniref:involucrin isoform X2 n=1 Tax=Lutzomyia longipalpis TaxID=7200 RepID=UPI00248337AD|nr:involucrin isoform X2 [Lutzomyia longipalpis]
MAKVFLVIALAFVATGVLVEAKSGDRKKAFSGKPTKTPKSVVDLFNGLPEEDIKFLKELDKQFKVHGDTIKIRIERDNTTGTTQGKNSKRTIDGDLGYGYHRNHRPAGPNFYFSKPKLEFYPYSQEDIPPLPHPAQHQLQQHPLHHRNRQRLNFHPTRHQPHHYGHTAVEIQASPGYEIHENTFEHPPPPPQQPYHADFQQPAAYHHAEPVIVLKIPGPQKYAAHLRVLLQQYLEVRAAQFLQELQQQELHHQELQHQEQVNQHGNAIQETYVEEHIPETNGHTLATAQAGTPHDAYGPPGHDQQTTYAHPEHPEVPLAEAYGAPQQEQAIYDAPQQGQAVYETHEIHYEPQQAVFINQALYQNDPRAAYQGPAYLPNTAEQPAEQQQFYYQQQQEHHHAEDDLPSSENYPSEQHTRVIFTKELHKGSTPKSTQVEYQEEYQAAPIEQHSTVTPLAFRTQEYYQPHEVEMDDVVAITQKPFNYHAHVSSTTLSPPAKRDVPPYTEEQFKKLSKLVHKLKRKQEVTEESN